MTGDNKLDVGAWAIVSAPLTKEVSKIAKYVEMPDNSVSFMIGDYEMFTFEYRTDYYMVNYKIWESNELKSEQNTLVISTTPPKDGNVRFIGKMAVENWLAHPMQTRNELVG